VGVRSSTDGLVIRTASRRRADTRKADVRRVFEKAMRVSNWNLWTINLIVEWAIRLE